MSLFYEKNIGW